MSSSNSLDQPLYKAQKKAKPTAGDVGIELEIEGKVQPTDEAYWALKDEGSLRGGGEYVLQKPSTMANLPNVLLSLQKALDIGRPVNSIRCSTHIHVNVTPYTPRQIWQILLAYYLLEPLLVRSQPKKRWANLFCLDMEHAEAIFLDLEEDLNMVGQTPFRGFTRDRNRYAALNLVSIHKFGSIEFRFLDAMIKTSDILAWARILHNLVSVASELSPVRLLKTYDEIPATDFVRTLLGSHADKYILDKLPPGLDINNLIHTNYDYVVELAQDLATRKFELPKQYWNDDFIDPEEVRMRMSNGLTGGVAGLAVDDGFLDDPTPMPGDPVSINTTGMTHAQLHSFWQQLHNDPWYAPPPPNVPQQPVNSPPVQQTPTPPAPPLPSWSVITDDDLFNDPAEPDNL